MGVDVTKEEIEILIGTARIAQLVYNLPRGFFRAIPSFPKGEIKSVDLPIKNAENVVFEAAFIVASKMNLETKVRRLERLDLTAGIRVEWKIFLTKAFLPTFEYCDFFFFPELLGPNLRNRGGLDKTE